MDIENWRSLDFLGYDNYSVSDKGRVRNNKSGRILDRRSNSPGYRVVILRDRKSKPHDERVSRLVLLAFVGYPPNTSMTCDHINRNIKDNSLSNLRWATREEQIKNSSNSTITNEHLYIPIAQYSPEGYLIKVWPSRASAARGLNLDDRGISKAQTDNNIYGGFYWKNTPNNTYLADEIWKPMIDPRFYDYYVSSYGRVLTRARNITYGTSCDGYKLIAVKFNGRYISRKVHCLVIEAFYGPSNLIVNHKDGNKSNNHISNLEYVTYSENVKHAYKLGLIKNRYKPVVQCTLDNKPIVIYKSIKTALDKNKISSLVPVLSRRTHTCAGYKWYYLEDLCSVDSDEHKSIVSRFDNSGIIMVNDFLDKIKQPVNQYNNDDFIFIEI